MMMCEKNVLAQEEMIRCYGLPRPLCECGDVPEEKQVAILWPPSRGTFKHPFNMSVYLSHIRCDVIILYIHTGELHQYIQMLMSYCRRLRRSYGAHECCEP